MKSYESWEFEKVVKFYVPICPVYALPVTYNALLYGHFCLSVYEILTEGMYLPPCSFITEQSVTLLGNKMSAILRPLSGKSVVTSTAHTNIPLRKVVSFLVTWALIYLNPYHS